MINLVLLQQLSICKYKYDSFNVNTYHLVRTDNTPAYILNSLDVSSYVTAPSYSRFFYDPN